MSAPQTNVETQKRRHRGPLVGMLAVVIFAVGLIVYWLIEEAAQSDPGEGSATQVDGRTGDPVEQPPSAPTEAPPPSPTPDAPPTPDETPSPVPESPATEGPSPEIPPPPAEGGAPQGG